ncbi:MAG: hypothetical protein ACPGJH_01875 [Alphaproteobacteria bacterium]
MLGGFDYNLISSLLSPFVAMFLALVDIQPDTRGRMAEAFISTSLISLRSMGINATYDDLIVDPGSNEILINNVQFQFHLHDEICNFDSLDESIRIGRSHETRMYVINPEQSLESWWSDPCQSTISIPQLRLTGIGLRPEVDMNFGLELQEATLQLKAFNTPKWEALKLATGLKENLTLDFSLSAAMNNGRNQMDVRWEMSSEKLFALFVEASVDQVVFRSAGDYVPFVSGRLVKFNTRLDNLGLLKAMQTLHAMTGGVIPLEEILLDSMPDLTLENAIIYPTYASFHDKLAQFLTQGSSLECLRRSPHPFNNWFSHALEDDPGIIWPFFCEIMMVDQNLIHAQHVKEDLIQQLLDDNKQLTQQLRAEHIAHMRRKILLEEMQKEDNKTRK